MCGRGIDPISFFKILQVLAELQKSHVAHPSVDDLMEDGMDRYVVEEDGIELLDVAKDEPARLNSGKISY